VQIHPRPLIAVLSTGDELVDVGADLGPGQIHASNRAMLSAAVAAAGGDVLDLGIAGDDQAQLEARIRQGLQQADMLLTTGGVSMGDLDFVKPLLESAGHVHFGRLRMKPGKPCTFATAEVDGRRRLVFGLPGNPVSGLVTFYLLALPALRRLAGWPDPTLPRIQAHLAQPLALDPWRPEYHRAVVHWERTLNSGRGGFLAQSTGSQASSRLLSMRSANVLLELPQAEGTLPAGAVVDALVIGEVK
jgi:gephyrin